MCWGHVSGVSNCFWVIYVLWGSCQRCARGVLGVYPCSAHLDYSSGCAPSRLEGRRKQRNGNPERQQDAKEAVSVYNLGEDDGHLHLSSAPNCICQLQSCPLNACTSNWNSGLNIGWFDLCPQRTNKG